MSYFDRSQFLSKEQRQIAEQRLIEISTLSKKEREQVLQEHGGELSFCKTYFPQWFKESNKKRIFITLFIILFFTGLLSLGLFIKSLTPLFTYNTDNKQLEFLGGRYKVPVFQWEYLDTNIVKTNTVFDLGNQKRIEIDAQRTQLFVTFRNSKSINITCLAKKAEDMVVIEKDDNVLIQLSDLNRCDVIMPDTLPVSMIGTAISLNMFGHLNQDFEVEISQSMIVWKVLKDYRCFLTADSESSVVDISDEIRFEKNKRCNHYFKINGSYLKIYPQYE